MKKAKKIEAPHRCYICDTLAMGIPGVDFQMVANRGQTRYYCSKCFEKERGNG